MRIHCINLDRRRDRRDHITAECARHGIVFDRIAAIDAADPAIAAKAAQLPPGLTGGPMSAGAYGCFASHRAAWCRLVASGDGHAVIFEDDIRLAHGIAACLDPGWIPRGADIVRLETFGTRVHLDRRAAASVAGRGVHRLRSTHLGTGGYVISAVCASALLAETARFRDPVDHVLFDESLAALTARRVFQMVPAPVTQAVRRPAGADADWARSSIPERHMARSAGSTAAESPLDRLWRRGRNEIRARLRRTGYVVVPFG
ncbi:glycosyltransferase family 25 protein [Limimaricola sp.]|uniref:glycosyltransferase family 25 protein n=1 Tax=Limimaricola sp. TaxID=2211665 RepID=UPI004057E288